MESKQVHWAAINKDEDHESSSINLNQILAATSSSSSTSSCGPLYELDDLMAQLPIKRGLSKFYNGKSQTFACLSSVESVEDLAKKEITGCGARMKSCKSYAGNLHKFGPKATIAKIRSPRSPSSSLSFTTSKAAMVIHTFSLSHAF